VGAPANSGDPSNEHLYHDAASVVVRRSKVAGRGHHYYKKMIYRNLF
jgi:hypothetical protein